MALGTPVAGTVAFGAFDGPIVDWPVGIVKTDVVLVFVGFKPATANTGSVNSINDDYGSLWTQRGLLQFAGGYGATLGADTGNTTLGVYSWDSVVASPTGSLSISISNCNISWAFVVRVPTGGGQISFGSATGQQTSAPATTSLFVLTNNDGQFPTNFYAGDLAIWAMCIPTDVQTPTQFSSNEIAASGAIFSTGVELNEPDSSTNNDIGGFSAYAFVTAQSTLNSASIASTLAGTRTNVRGPVVVVRIRETNGNFFLMF